MWKFCCGYLPFYDTIVSQSTEYHDKLEVDLLVADFYMASFADDLNASAKRDQLQNMMINILREGPKHGYHPNNKTQVLIGPCGSLLSAINAHDSYMKILTTDDIWMLMLVRKSLRIS